MIHSQPTLANHRDPTQKIRIRVMVFRYTGIFTGIRCTHSMNSSQSTRDAPMTRRDHQRRPLHSNADDRSSMAAAASSRDGQLYALALIVSGTFSTVISKTQYDVRSHGTEVCVDPTDPTKTTTLCAFDKPWFSVLLAKLAMAVCLLYLYVRKAALHRKYLETPLLRMRKHGRKYLGTTEASTVKSKRNLESAPLLSHGDSLEDEDATQISWPTIVAIAWPSLLDLLQTLIANVGLLWVSSSVYQMARGSVIIFSAFLSVKFMGKHLYAYHYASIIIVGLSVVLVGWAGTSPSDETTSTTGDSTSNAILGLALIVLAQLLTALQIVVEEHFMVTRNVSPMLLVGYEGLWGLVFYVVLIPILTLTPPGTSAISKIWHEDFYDSMVKIWNSPTQIVLCVLTVFVVAVLNVTANYVTKHLSAVMRSITETLRTLGVWLLGLFVYYVINWRGIESPGEAWTTASWIELVGFVLMVYGTLAYKKVIEIPLPVLYAAEARDHQNAAYKSPFMTGSHK